MYRAQLRWQPITILLTLALVWGANMATIKIAAKELAPLFMAGLHSLVASVCLYVWVKAKGITLFPSPMIAIHGVVIGLLFGANFDLIYVGLQYALASRTYILFYTAPFFVAIGAHFFLKGERLNSWRVSGLILAFAGVVILFMRDLGSFSLSALPGDLMALGSGALWGTTTVYTKRYLSHQTVPLQTLFYQLLFFTPLLFLMSLVLEKPTIEDFSLVTGLSLFYQCIIVAFLSYLSWFELIDRYPVSLLHAFSFFTPAFGVCLSGALILGGLISPNIVAALILVSMGMFLVNRLPASRPAAHTESQGG